MSTNLANRNLIDDVRASRDSAISQICSAPLRAHSRLCQMCRRPLLRLDELLAGVCDHCQTDAERGVER